MPGSGNAKRNRQIAAEARDAHWEQMLSLSSGAERDGVLAAGARAAKSLHSKGKVALSSVLDGSGDSSEVAAGYALDEVSPLEDGVPLNPGGWSVAEDPGPPQAGAVRRSA